MDEQMKLQLEGLFGKLAVESAGILEPAYGAAIARFGVKEAIALEQLLNGKKMAEAKELIRSKMTQQELADEKTKLAELTFEAAVSGAGQWSFAGAALTAGLKVLLAVALGAVGL